MVVGVLAVVFASIVVVINAFQVPLSAAARIDVVEHAAQDVCLHVHQATNRRRKRVTRRCAGACDHQSAGALRCENCRVSHGRSGGLSKMTRS